MRNPTVGTHSISGVPAAAGRIAHLVIGYLLTLGSDLPVTVEQVEQLVHAECRGLGASLNAQRVRALALTSACKYMHWLMPTSAEFIGAEVRLTTGRVDLMWLLPDGSIFMDELKTSRYLDEAAAVTQAARYATAGVDMFGDGFVGVRVISTTQQRRSLLVTPDLAVKPLAGSELAIPQVRVAGLVSRAV